MTLYTIASGMSSTLVADMFRVFFPDARTVLDMTYGNGKFWVDDPPVDVLGIDIDCDRAKHVAANFTELPFIDNAFDVAVFDPPYHTDMGRGKASVMGSRFGTYRNIPELMLAVALGSREARRVSRIGALIKVQDYVHASRVQFMDRWVIDELGWPYDRVMQARQHKIIDPKWKEQLSAYRNHAVWLAYRWDGQVHKRRKGVAV